MKQSGFIVLNECFMQWVIYVCHLCNIHFACGDRNYLHFLNLNLETHGYVDFFYFSQRSVSYLGYILWVRWCCVPLNAVIVTPAPTLRPSRSREPGSPALRTPAIIIMHACLPPVTCISNYWTHLDSITSVITFSIFIWFPAMFPASALIDLSLCWPWPCLVWLPVPASHLLRRSLVYRPYIKESLQRERERDTKRKRERERERERERNL